MVNKSLAKLRQEAAMLKKRKEKAEKQKGQLLSRQRELNEIKQLEKEIKFLEGVGSNKRIAKEVGVKLGKQAGHFGLKGLKIAGKLVKGAVMAEVKRQEADNRRPASKAKKRVLNTVKRRATPKVKSKPKPRVRAKVKNGRRR